MKIHLHIRNDIILAIFHALFRNYYLDKNRSLVLNSEAVFLIWHKKINPWDQAQSVILFLLTFSILWSTHADLYSFLR